VRRFAKLWPTTNPFSSHSNKNNPARLKTPVNRCWLPTIRPLPHTHPARHRRRQLEPPPLPRPIVKSPKSSPICSHVDSGVRRSVGLADFGMAMDKTPSGCTQLQTRPTRRKTKRGAFATVSKLGSSKIGSPIRQALLLPGSIASLGGFLIKHGS
jgi:hypothetical protein